MAVVTNKNEWANAYANSIAGQKPVAKLNEGGEGGGDNPNQGTNKYDALETTSYKEMLSSKIQAANARDQALKYASASLGSSGFAGQGMAESTRTGIMGNYNRAIMGADEQHQANLMDIEAQRQEEMDTQGEEDWQSVMTMLSQATSKEDLDYLKSEFYGNMNDKQKKMFDYYYSSYARDLESGDVQENAKWAQRVFETTELKEEDGTSYKNFAATIDVFSNLKNNFELEGADDLKNFYMTANDGDLVQVYAENDQGKSQNGYAMFYKGKLYNIDSALVGNRPIKTKVSLKVKK